MKCMKRRVRCLTSSLFWFLLLIRDAYWWMSLTLIMPRCWRIRFQMGGKLLLTTRLSKPLPRRPASCRWSERCLSVSDVIGSSSRIVPSVQSACRIRHYSLCGTTARRKSASMRVILLVFWEIIVMEWIGMKWRSEPWLSLASIKQGARSFSVRTTSLPLLWSWSCWEQKHGITSHTLLLQICWMLLLWLQLVIVMLLRQLTLARSWRDGDTALFRFASAICQLRPQRRHLSCWRS